MHRLLIFLAFCLHASAQITVVSAASYQPVVAPDSLASLFGSGLANTTATATLDSKGQLPTQLAGVSVEIDGTATPLLYVSPKQINFLVLPGTDLGTADVLVRSSTPGTQFKGTMQVRNVAPAIFSKDATGKGPGAILNAVTFTGEPFLVETPQNSGDDKRTRIAVFATGLRFAGNPSRDPDQENVAIQVQARDSSGNSYDVEYAGSAPGFFGLDQINLILPAEADNAGVISLAIAAGDTLSNTVTFKVGSLPDSEVHLSGLTLSPTSIIAGNDVSGTVALNARARFGGYNVSLANNSVGVTTPLSVTVPQGQASANFTAHTGSIAKDTVTITASSGSFSESQSVQIYPINTPHLTSLTLSVKQIQGGTKLSGTLALSGEIGLGGATIQLTSSDPTVVVPPASVSLGFGASSASFDIVTKSVTAPDSVTITAAFANSTASATLTVNPALAITFTSAAVVGGAPVAATVSLAQAGTTNASVSLKSSDSQFAPVPASVIVPAGQLSASFTIPTSVVTAPRTIIITASFAGASASGPITLNPPGLPSVTALTLDPKFVQGGKSSAGAITLSSPAPIGGLVVDLSTDNPFVAQIPAFVLIASGQSKASFVIATPVVTATQTATITASAGGESQSATLTVQ